MYDRTVVPQQNVICLILIEKLLVKQDTNLAKTKFAKLSHRELRAKDLERLNNFVDDLKAKEKRGLSKEQKEELACAEKVRDFVQTGTDVRCCSDNPNLGFRDKALQA